MPGADWITVSLSNIVNFSDPSGLFRVDASFRVLTFLTVQAFASFFYGQGGGELRFQLSDALTSQLNDIARALGRAQLPSTVTMPPLAQVGVLLRVSI